VDPEARVVVTARDATAAAFASADKNLKQFQRTATGMKNLLTSLGVVFSGRALLSWVTNSVKAAEATGEHADQIREAKSAMEDMKKASDELALSVGITLIPAFQNLGKVFTGLNALFFNADKTPLGKEIADIEEQIRELKKHAIDPGFGELVYSKEDKARLEELSTKLDELKRKQAEALGLFTDATTTRQNMAMRQAIKGMDLIGDFEDRWAHVKGQFDRQPPMPIKFEVEWLTDGPQGDGLKEILAGNGADLSVPVVAQLEQIDQSEIDALFKPIESESEKTARAIGDDFRDAFANWLTDGEFRFKDFLKNIAAQWISSRIFDDLGKIGGSGSFFSKLFGGARAEGGPVSSGKAYVVGERGPEWFLPGQSGTVAPMAAGGPTVVQNFYNQVGIPPQWAAQTATAGQMAARAAFDAIKKQQRGER
jgi:hypothetical protein